MKYTYIFRIFELYMVIFGLYEINMYLRMDYGQVTLYIHNIIESGVVRL